MAQKDASQKILESYNDVFSDIVNVERAADAEGKAGYPERIR